jgi:glycerol-3-phosphate dehydrogenase (NAD(P)+)
MPICDAVYRVCYENIDINQEVKKLLKRDKKDEVKLN